MKKTILFVAAFVFVLSVVIAQPGIEIPEDGIGNDTIRGRIENETGRRIDNLTGNYSVNGSRTSNYTGRARGMKNKIKNKIRNRTGIRLGLRIREGNFSGNFTTPSGNQIQIMSHERGRARIRSNNTEAETEMNLTTGRDENNRTNIQARLSSNGRKANIKIMPDQASERALQRLRLRNCNETNNCSIQLKETGKGNKTRAIYEVRARKKAKVLGIFNANMDVEAEVDSETGEVVRSRKPWWAFLASE